VIDADCRNLFEIARAGQSSKARKSKIKKELKGKKRNAADRRERDMLENCWASAGRSAR
jgi:hypothetical protein